MSDHTSICPTCGSVVFVHEAEGEGQTGYIAPIYTPETASEYERLTEQVRVLTEERDEIKEQYEALAGLARLFCNDYERRNIKPKRLRRRVRVCLQGSFRNLKTRLEATDE